jgi:hypothetical protein
MDNDKLTMFYSQWIEDRRDQFVLFEVSAALSTDFASFMRVFAMLDFTQFTTEQLVACSEYPVIAQTSLANLFACMARISSQRRPKRAIQGRRKRGGKN